MSDNLGALFFAVDHHELARGGLHGTPDTSLIATKYSVAFVVDTFQRRSCERKREARAEQKALLQLFSSTASIALMRMPRVLSIAIKTTITVSPYMYLYAVAFLLS